LQEFVFCILPPQLHCFVKFCLLTPNGRTVTLLAMPPAWVNFSWVMVRGKSENVKHVSAMAVSEHARFPPFLQ
jgi:hypothetical protein